MTSVRLFRNLITLGLLLLSLSVVRPAIALAQGPAYNQALERLQGFGLLQGLEQKEPGSTVSRAELVRLLVRAAGHSQTAALAAGARPYPDTAGHPDAGYILVARNMGLLSTPPGHAFAPDRAVTWNEALEMVSRLAGLSPEAAAHLILSRPETETGQTPAPGLLAQPMPWAQVAVLADQVFSLPRAPDGLNLYQRQFDAVPPELFLDSIPASTAESQILVGGTARGARSVAINGKEVARGPGTLLRFRVRWPLEVGINTIQVTVRDDAGNTTTAERTIERTPPPPARLEGPSEIRVRAGEASQVAIRAFDAAGNPVAEPQISAVVAGGVGTFDPDARRFVAGRDAGRGSLRLQAGTASLTIPVVVEPAPIARVEVSLNPPAAAPGTIVTVNLRAFDIFGREVADVEPEWQLDAPNVVFDPTERRLIAAKPGRWPLTATVEGVSGEATVAIWGEVAQLRLDGPAEVVGNNQALAEFTVTAVDRFGTPVGDARNRVRISAEGAQTVTRFGNTLTSLYLNKGSGTFYVRADSTVWDQAITVSATDYADSELQATATLQVVPQQPAAVQVIPSAPFLVSNDTSYTANVAFEVVDTLGAPMLEGAWEIEWELTGPAVEAESHQTRGEVFYQGGGPPAELVLAPELGGVGPVTITGRAPELSNGSGTLQARFAAGATRLALNLSQVRAGVTDQPADGVEVQVSVTDETGVPAPYSGVVYLDLSSGLAAAGPLRDGDSLVDRTGDGVKDRVALSFDQEHSRTLSIAVTKAGLSALTATAASQQLAGARATVSWTANPDPAQLEVRFALSRTAAVVPLSDPSGTLTVEVLDGWGNPVFQQGVEVTLVGLEGTEPSGAVTLNGKAEPVTVKTNSRGQATVQVVVAPSVGRDFKVKITEAILDDQSLGIDADRQVFEVNVASAVADQLELSFRSPGGSRLVSARAGSPVVLQAVVRDQFGEPLAGMEGLLVAVLPNQTWAREAAPPDGYGTPNSAEEIKALTWTHLGDTDPEQVGVYHLTLYPASPGQQTVTVELDMWRKRLRETARFLVKPGPPHGLVLKGTEETLELSEEEWVPVTLAVSDAWGNPTTGNAPYQIQVTASDGALLRLDPRGLDLNLGRVVPMLHEVTLYVMVPRGRTPGTITFSERDGQLLPRTYTLTLPPTASD